MEEYDVVIIGAGPAGLSAAIELSKHKSIKCLLLDKNKFLDVSTRSWTTFNSLVKKYHCLDCVKYRLNQVMFRSLRGSAYTVDLGKDFLWVLDEKKFKKKLLEKVKIEKTEKTAVIKIIREKNRIKLNTNSQDIMTKILIDASGDAGLCRRMMNLEIDTYGYVKCRILTGCNFVGDTTPWGILLTKKKRNETFIAAWAEPYSKSRVLIATESYAHKKVNPKVNDLILNKFMQDKDFKKIFKRAMILREWDTKYPLTPLEKVAYDNIMLVGDAGAQSTPLMMEGIRPGMFEGKIAARIAASAIKRKDYSFTILKKYQE